MGQKVHPIGFRIGVIRDWGSNWYAGKKDYPKRLHEDHQIRTFLRKRLANAAISKVTIDPQADKLIHASVTSNNTNAVKAEASYLTQVQPSLFQPAVDAIEVWKTSISGPPTSFETLTQYQLNPEFWYFTKK